MKYLEIPIEVNGSVEDARLETYILDTPVEKIGRASCRERV